MNLKELPPLLRMPLGPDELDTCVGCALRDPLKGCEFEKTIEAGINLQTCIDSEGGRFFIFVPDTPENRVLFVARKLTS